MKSYVNKHISQVYAGDTVLVNGREHTLCSKDIKYSTFMGDNLSRSYSSLA